MSFPLYIFALPSSKINSGKCTEDSSLQAPSASKGFGGFLFFFFSGFIISTRFFFTYYVSKKNPAGKLKTLEYAKENKGMTLFLCENAQNCQQR